MELSTEIQIDADVLFDRASKVVSDCGYSKTTSDKPSRRLRFDTGMSTMSWGETVEVFAEPISEGKSLLHVGVSRRIMVNLGSRPEGLAKYLLNRIVAECASK